MNFSFFHTVQDTLMKNENFLHKKIREINWILIFSVKTLVSQNFCKNVKIAEIYSLIDDHHSPFSQKIREINGYRI